MGNIVRSSLGYGSQGAAEEPGAQLRPADDGPVEGEDRQPEAAEIEDEDGSGSEHEVDDGDENDGTWDDNPWDFVRHAGGLNPTIDDITRYAEQLGMDVEQDSDLMWIARDGLAAPLADPWVLCHYRRENDELRYVNCHDFQILRDRPDMEEHRQLFKRELAKKISSPALMELSAAWALTGEQVFTSRFLPTDSVKNLRQEIAKATGNDRESCQLQVVHEGSVLCETLRLEETSLCNGAVVGVTRSVRDVTVVLSEATMRVVTGSPAEIVFVGAMDNCSTFAQNPPDVGDTWEVRFTSEAIAYDVIFVGGDNEWHGILSVYIDDELVGEFDQYGRHTSYPTKHVLRWQAPSAGTHLLRGKVTAKRPESHGYWVCIKEIVFSPAASEDQSDRVKEDDNVA